MSTFFVARTPLLPQAALTEFEQSAGDRQTLRGALERALRDPVVEEAVFLASPSLHRSLALWRADPDDRRARKVETALYRYVVRAATRPTPFGLFAGWSTGTAGDDTRVELRSREHHLRHTRLDMAYVHAHVAGDVVREDALLTVNPTLRRVRGEVQWVEAVQTAAGRSFELSAADAAATLDAVLAAAARPAPRQSVVEAVAATGPPHEVADGYVSDLIDAQILVPADAPPVTGPLVVPPALREAHAALRDLDAAGPGRAVARYEEIAAALPDGGREGQLFQVDLHKPADVATIGPQVLRDLQAGAELLRRITPAAPDAELERFRRAIGERWGDREVPLLEAIAAVAGADPAPLLDGLGLQAPSAHPPPPSPVLLEAVASGAEEIELSDDDIARLSVEDPPPLPAAYAVTAVPAAGSGRAVELLISGVDGPSGARLLGRFCHADHELVRHVREHLRAEEANDPDAVFAEIAHLPEGRAGNVLARPVLRAYEIPYAGGSGAPHDRQIGVEDLLVSVADGRIVLRSRRLGRRVVPRLTSAHNFRGPSLPLYRSLCALQDDGFATPLAWRWGALAAAPFLPRMRRGAIVLSLARWNVPAPEVRALKALPDAERLEALSDLRERRRLPRHVALQEGDQVLALDLENVLAIDALVQAAGRCEVLAITERWPGPERLLARAPEGRLACEIVVPFAGSAPADLPPVVTSSPAPAAIPRRFVPGADWTSANLFCDTTAADELISDVLAPLGRRLDASGWFFLRYDEPSFHVRFRVRAPAATALAELRAAAGTWFEDGSLWRLQLDTYEREVERYGGPAGIAAAEAIFHHDSEAVAETLELLARADDAEQMRWRLGVVGVHTLLRGLGLEGTVALELVRERRERFAAELSTGAGTNKALAARFRHERGGLEELLAGARDRAGAAAALAALRAASLTIPLTAVAASLAHMHLNRLHRTAPRAHEFVTYDFLARLYEAERRRGG